MPFPNLNLQFIICTHSNSMQMCTCANKLSVGSREMVIMDIQGFYSLLSWNKHHRPQILDVFFAIDPTWLFFFSLCKSQQGEHAHVFLWPYQKPCILTSAISLWYGRKYFPWPSSLFLLETFHRSHYAALPHHSTFWANRWLSDFSRGHPIPNTVPGTH